MIIIYLLAMTIVLLLRKNLKTKVFPYPELKIRDDGIYFVSTKRHRMYIDNAKVMQVGSTVYIKAGKILITLMNVDRVYVNNKYIYFNALGNVSVLCNMRKIKRYFSLDIHCNKLDIDKMKRNAKNELINHLFNINECVALKEYLTIISHVLNIRVTNDKVIVGKNKYNISYTLYYKVCNVIKKVNIISR